MQCRFHSFDPVRDRNGIRRRNSGRSRRSVRGCGQEYDGGLGIQSGRFRCHRSARRYSRILGQLYQKRRYAWHGYSPWTSPDDRNSDIEINKIVVKVDPKYFRPTEVELLIGDPSKAKQKLGWSPKRDLAQLVKEMVASDVNLFQKDKLLQKAGHAIKNWNE